jgi:hypothetical protein
MVHIHSNSLSRLKIAVKTTCMNASEVTAGASEQPPVMDSPERLIPPQTGLNEAAEKEERIRAPVFRRKASMEKSPFIAPYCIKRSSVPMLLASVYPFPPPLSKVGGGVPELPTEIHTRQGDAFPVSGTILKKTNKTYCMPVWKTNCTTNQHFINYSNPLTVWKKLDKAFRGLNYQA